MPATTTRVRTSICPELIPGTMVANPVFQILRLTGDSLQNKPKTVISNEKRTDRMQADVAIVGKDVGGSIDGEFTNKTADQFILEAAAGTWVKTPEVNGVLGVAAGTGVYTFAAGPLFVVGNYVRITGCANAANNGYFRVTAAGAGTVTTSNLASVLEAATPATARIKAVGYKAAANGDTKALVGNQIQSALNPALFGLVPGMWFQCLGFTGTPANNDWYRAGAITGAGPYIINCDTVPTGFAADAAAGAQIVIAFTDYIRNGVTRNTHSTERAFLDAAGGAIYDYRLGDQADTLTVDIKDQQIVTYNASFKGMDTIPPSAVQAAGATYLAAGTSPTINGATGWQRIAEALTKLNGGTQNLPLELKLMLKNNLRDQPAGGQIGLAGVGFGDFEVTADVTTYLDTPALLAKLWANTPTSLDTRYADANGDGYLYDIPAAKLEDGDPQGGQKNNDVTPTYTFRGLPFAPAAGGLYNLHVQKFEKVI